MLQLFLRASHAGILASHSLLARVSPAIRRREGACVRLSEQALPTVGIRTQEAVGAVAPLNVVEGIRVGGQAPPMSVIVRDHLYRFLGPYIDSCGGQALPMSVIRTIRAVRAIRLFGKFRSAPSPPPRRRSVSTSVCAAAGS